MSPSKFLGEQSGSRSCGAVETMPSEGLGERVHRGADITDDSHRHRIVGVDFGREPMEMDDLLVAMRVDPHRVELLQLIPHRNNDVGVLKAEIGVVTPHKADRPHAVRMVIGHRTLTVEGVGHRHTELLGEPNQCRRRTSTSGAVTGK
ncbi:Uncharacterised protein [Mycobacteroides abscessus subsp. abscessus]|nr:Uncharacterised protein [Mycobacteroides abscessus subsp. abscessus]